MWKLFFTSTSKIGNCAARLCFCSCLKEVDTVEIGKKEGKHQERPYAFTHVEQREQELSISVWRNNWQGRSWTDQDPRSVAATGRGGWIRAQHPLFGGTALHWCTLSFWLFLAVQSSAQCREGVQLNRSYQTWYNTYISMIFLADKIYFMVKLPPPPPPPPL